MMADQIAGSAPPQRKRYIGESVLRLEDFPLVTGRACFVGDLSFPRELHARIVRSAHARGRIREIETDAAKQLPGVVAVWTGADLAEVPNIPFRATAIKGLTPYT